MTLIVGIIVALAATWVVGGIIRKVEEPLGRVAVFTESLSAFLSRFSRSFAIFAETTTALSAAARFGMMRGGETSLVAVFTH